MKKLLILSGKGGTGKTSTAAAFIRFSQCRAIADCDVDAPNLHLLLAEGREPERSIFYGGDKAYVDPALCIGCGACREVCRFDAISIADGVSRVDDFACEGCGVCAAVCPAEAVSLRQDAAGEQRLYRGEGVFSTAELKMGRGNSGKLVTAVKQAMLKNAPDTDIAVIDGSPGIGCPVIASVSGVDLVLVVAEPSLSGISDLERLVKTCGSFRTRLAVCVNKWDSSPENTEAIERFCRERGLVFAGRIPYDRAAPEAINSGRSLADIDCPAREALRAVYACVMKALLEERK